MSFRRHAPLFACLLAALPAAAREPAPGPDGATQPPAIVDDEEPAPPLIPPASDAQSGHFLVSAGGLFGVPFGRLEQGTRASDLGLGYGAALDLGFGIARTVTLGAWGQFLSHSGGGNCPNCTGTNFAVGPFVGYHLVQGTRFNPWLTLGAGYRASHAELLGLTGEYSGIEFLHLAIGGDLYVGRNFGLGPWLEVDGGVFLNHVKPLKTTAAHGMFSCGLRISFDLPGR